MAELWRAEVREWLFVPPGTDLAGKPLPEHRQMLCPYVLAVHHSGTEAEATRLAEAEMAGLLAVSPDRQLDVNCLRDKSAEFWQAEAARDDYERLLAGGGVVVNLWQAMLDKIDDTAETEMAETAEVKR